jgi:hypothetical protein
MLQAGFLIIMGGMQYPKEIDISTLCLNTALITINDLERIF